ncbi:MAG: hypothetical protein GVY04_23600 [Cyanobacteria bacterium]|nr:hypothetical protein [Cyanobacteria bacterium GSL.Bin1]
MPESNHAIAQAGAGGASRRESEKGGAIAKILKKHQSQRLRLPKRKAPALTVGQQGTIAFSASNAETGQLLQALD